MNIDHPDPQRFIPIVEPDGSMLWKLQPNCSMSPRQLFIALVLVSCPSLLVGIAFFLQGLAWVTLFNGMELLVLLAAFGWYARSAGDSERIRVSQDHVDVQICEGNTLLQQRFNRALTTVSMRRDNDDLLTLAESGSRVTFGKFIPRHLRPQFFQLMRKAIAQPYQPLEVGHG